MHQLYVSMWWLMTRTDGGNTIYFSSISMQLNAATKISHGNLLPLYLAHGKHAISGSSCSCYCCCILAIMFILLHITLFIIEVVGEKKKSAFYRYTSMLHKVVLSSHPLNMPRHISSLVKFLETCMHTIFFPSPSLFFSFLILFSHHRPYHVRGEIASTDDKETVLNPQT